MSYVASLKCSGLALLDDTELAFTGKAGWTTLYGDHAAKKLRVLQAIAVGLVGPHLSAAFWVRWSDWVKAPDRPVRDLNNAPKILLLGTTTFVPKPVYFTTRGESHGFPVWETSGEANYREYYPSVGFAAPSIYGSTSAERVASNVQSRQRELQLLGLFSGMLSQSSLPVYLRERRHVLRDVALDTRATNEFASLIPLVAVILDSLATHHQQSPVKWDADHWYCLHSGIVLLDHAEREVHPKHHARLPKWFKEHFPYIQFITTSNSAELAAAGDHVIDGFDLGS